MSKSIAAALIVATVGLGSLGAGAATAANHGHHHERAAAAFRGLPDCADADAVNCFVPGPTDGQAWSDAHYVILVESRVRYTCTFFVGAWDSKNFDICT